jgi:hypothetical protein
VASSGGCTGATIAANTGNARITSDNTVVLRTLRLNGARNSMVVTQASAIT